MTTKTLRSCIVSEKDYTFLSIDASQIELRVLAILSQDPQLLSDLATGDLHTATMLRMWGDIQDPELRKKKRYEAKTGNFALVYGADEFTLARILECEIWEAEEFMADHRAAYPRLYEWMEEVKTQAAIDGYVINIFGRIRPIPELKSGNWKIREKAERETVNTVVQGTAVDIVKKMMLYLRRLFVPEIRLVLQVHDEIVWEVPDVLLLGAIQGASELDNLFPDYPCSIEYGKSYGEMEKYG